MFNPFEKKEGYKRLSELFVTEVVSSHEFVGKDGKKAVMAVLKVVPTWDIFSEATKRDIESQRFFGKAYCAKDDVYDPVKGHDLANHRAMVKAYRFINDMILGYAGAVLSSASRFANQVNDKIKKQESFIDNLSK